MKTYRIITIGCQMNKSDSERVAGYLEGLGYRIAAENRADLVVLNTCGVRQSAEDRAYGLVHQIEKNNPRAMIVLTGCLSAREDVRQKLKGKVDIWLPINKLPELHKKLPVMSCGFPGDDYLKIKPKYGSKFSAFVPIGSGCNNFCAYCVVPQARGREVYRPAGDILDEVNFLVKRGFKEIILVAQNVNSYKFSIPNSQSPISNSKYNYFFADLLKAVNTIPGKFWIRFATSHPKDMSDELIAAVAECDKACEHVHLPAQAGDDQVLERMNRGYTKKGYTRLIEKIRRKVKYQISPDNYLPPAITTDIIVGFPGETGGQFANTLKLFKEIKFDMAYIARYSPRPGTAAAELSDDVSKAEKGGREEELTRVLRQTALENNQKYLGKTVEVLVEGRNRRGEWLGKTRTAKNVRIKRSNIKYGMGAFVEVKITEARDFGIVGEIK